MTLHRERPHPSVERGRPRSRDGALLCPAQFPGAPEPLVTYDLIGINSQQEPLRIELGTRPPVIVSKATNFGRLLTQPRLLLWTAQWTESCGTLSTVVTNLAHTHLTLARLCFLGFGQI